ncbi:bacteriohemerythrin [Pseudodesulfovibrio sp. zrk46]|uniref:bacteriohemerythrin n=1 Tax=Pseudodesulfovibrio sp. zrk46 TaxID=2725288 RepID=UPI00144A066A|nr:bacteriohemerythrin [Pseudodesulfovibrio sp. zrk46]QJB57620.1 hemerythrin family protein [Pseudodesulfovibrio sp. zrk46]
MPEIQWTEDHSVGVAEIDAQHKELVKITNRLFLGIMNDSAFQVLLDILYELERYVEYHFSYEEELLKTYGYSHQALVEHIEEHHRIKNQVSIFIKEYSSNWETMDIEVFDFLRDWTTDHLCTTDAMYKDFFKRNKVF